MSRRSHAEATTGRAAGSRMGVEMIETVVVLVIVGAAAWFVARSVLRSLHGTGDCVGGCKGCSSVSVCRTAPLGEEGVRQEESKG